MSEETVEMRLASDLKAQVINIFLYDEPVATITKKDGRWWGHLPGSSFEIATTTNRGKARLCDTSAVVGGDLEDIAVKTMLEIGIAQNWPLPTKLKMAEKAAQTCLKLAKRQKGWADAWHQGEALSPNSK